MLSFSNAVLIFLFGGSMVSSSQVSFATLKLLFESNSNSVSISVWLLPSCALNFSFKSATADWVAFGVTVISLSLFLSLLAEI